jgi:hypothetical protein
MDKTRIRGAGKLVDGSGKAAKVAGDAKPTTKARADKAVGKGPGAPGSKKDKLSNNFST